ncbi:MAG: xanthine dehydrogenase family protein molybdopterin-binding subunit [Betaproteobacteria bacterium]|nr:MAG: xanthine dehydrogenase family protein molybdopterin-binding subunit [Betaproteobacteria bacterium]
MGNVLDDAVAGSQAPLRNRDVRSPLGVSVPRARARRLLAGRGRYTDDVSLPGMLHVAFVRSPYPFARIASIDKAAAQASPGVVLVATGRELAGYCKPYAGIHELFVGMKAPEQWPMALERACWQGEPVLAVVAAGRAQAEDAAAEVLIDWQPLPALTDVEAAAAPDAPVIHPQIGSNIAYDTTLATGDSEAGFSDCAATAEAEFRFARHTGVCLEPRSIIAHYEAATPSLTVIQSHQCPAQQQDIYARLLGLPDHQVRVHCPDVGGAFGIKQQLYGDELAVCILSMMLRRPVKYVADRLESFMSDIHARDHRVSARLSIGSDGRAKALAVDDLFGVGAYSQFPRSSIGEGSHVLRLSGAPYVLQAYKARLRMVFQNKNMVGHYRAVGHPIATAVTEVLVDQAARLAGMDPIEVRRRSYIAPEAFPYRSHGGFTFEPLSLHACLERIVEMMDIPRLRAEQTARKDSSMRLGIGLATFVELTGTGAGYYGRGEARVSAQEGCLLKLEPSGRIRCAPSVTDQGQGTDTAIAQVVASAIGVPIDHVAVISGDSELTPYGGGAWASRGVSAGAEAAYRAARALRENILAVAGHMLASSPEALDIRESRVLDALTGQDRLSLADVARVGYFRQETLPAGFQPELSLVRHFVPSGRAFLITNGIHGSVAEVDTQTGIVTLRKHYVVHDSGTILNPMLLDEQIRGGVVQGLGAALYEEIPYGPEGEMLVGSMADYLVPMAGEMPDIEVAHICVPDRGTSLGAKGAGEAGTAGASAAVMNAVNDALAPLGAFLTEIPLTPERILRALGQVQ